MLLRSSSGRWVTARCWISLVESFERTMSVGVVRAMENMLRCMFGLLNCLWTSAMAVL